jgi:hypothetical protein
MIKRVLTILTFVAGVSLSTLPAQPVEFFPLSAVKPGLTGVGKTVFRGTTIDEFDVEILGVLDKVGPQQSIILARLSGEKVDESGVFAGMSGSPVYIDGKLVGAVAYAFSFATAPIAGITPIQEMVDVLKEHAPTSLHLVRQFSPAEFFQTISTKGWPSPDRDMSIEVAGTFPNLRQFGQLQPIQTPINLSGMLPESFESFSKAFASLGWMPVFGGAAASGSDWEDSPLEPGSTVAVQLVRGDMEIAASGTVTHVDGEKVYAFGHPFLSVGNTAMPMAKAAVLGVIPSLMNSQKISATTKAVGTIRQDRATGIMGIAGQNPDLVPVKLNLSTSRGESREFSYEVVMDSFLTPVLVAMTVQNSILASERSIGDQTIQMKCRISLKGQPEVTFENSASDMTGSSAMAALAAAAPVNFILSSGFENVVLQEINVDIVASEDTRETVLDKVWQDKVEAKPGEEVGVTVFLRKPSGEVKAERYPIKIPEGMPPGTLKVLIGDGMTITQMDAKADESQFIPKDLGQLVRAINNLKKNDRLYIRLFREQEGAVIGGEGLPGLPPSVLAQYNSKKTTGDVMPIRLVVFAEHELPSTDSVVSGQKIIQFEIEG